MALKLGAAAVDDGRVENVPGYDDEPHLYEFDAKSYTERLRREDAERVKRARRERERALKKSPRARWSVLVEESQVVEGSHIVLRMEQGDPTVVTETWLLLNEDARELRDALSRAIEEVEQG